MQAPKLVILGRDGILNRLREAHPKHPQAWEPLAGALDPVAQPNHSAPAFTAHPSAP